MTPRPLLKYERSSVQVASWCPAQVMNTLHRNVLLFLYGASRKKEYTRLPRKQETHTKNSSIDLLAFFAFPQNSQLPSTLTHQLDQVQVMGSFEFHAFVYAFYARDARQTLPRARKISSSTSHWIFTLAVESTSWQRHQEGGFGGFLQKKPQPSWVFLKKNQPSWVFLKNPALRK